MRLRYLLPLLLAMPLAALGVFQDGPLPLIPRDVPEGLRIALTAGRWDDARLALESARTAKPEEADLWLYLEAVAQAREGQVEGALASLQRFDTEHAESTLINKARFLRSELLAGARRFQEAEQLVEELARELRNPERQGELALVLIERADELAAEPSSRRPDVARDDGRALELYSQALTLEIEAGLRRRVLLASGASAARMGDPNRAVTFWRQLLEEEGLPAEDRSRAELALGRDLVAAGQGAAGRRVLEDLVRRLEGGAEAQALADARFALAEGWSAAGVQQIDLILGAYDRFVAEHGSDPRVVQAAFRAAEWLASAGRRDEAKERFVALRSLPVDEDLSADERSTSETLRTEALFLVGDIQQSQGLHAEARGTFEDYATSYPNGSRWSEAQQRIADNAKLLGFSLRNADDLEGAAKAWLAFLDTWPLDGGAPELHLELAELQALRAGKLDEQKADSRATWEQAVREWQAVAERFQGQDIAARALLRIGYVREQHLDDLEGAIEAYRACVASGQRAGDAQGRLSNLLEPSLEVLTQRTARGGEAAELLVRARNHETLDVRVYPLDLEAYFRKHLTHQRIEDLDLDLIAPALRFDVPFSDYQPFLPMERSVELPVEGPGVWAVSVAAGEQRATTLVLRSDLEILVKGSADGALLWAVDANQDAPAEGVKLLVSTGASQDSGPSLIEVTTDAEGLARVDYENDVDALAVLALRDGHYAADGQGLRGTAATEELSPRGVVYTDRSAYRPGDSVAWRALHRDAQDGRFTFTPKDRFRVELSDPSSRLLQRWSLESGEFGAIDGTFELPAGAPEGQWRLAVQKEGGPRWETSIQVREYSLQRVELDLEPTQRVWFRGDEVEIQVRAGFAWGWPLANASLRYSLPDGREFAARTDAEGACTLRFDSTEFVSSGTLTVRAWLPEENVGAEASIILARQAFSLAVELPKHAVLVGEGFAATVRCTDPGGTPLAQALELDILHRVSNGRRRWEETPVETRSLQTGEDGSARVELAYDKGGSYVLRARGVDRFGNPVSTQAVQFVSGSDDPVRLRLLADDTAVAVGETAQLRVVQRASAGLALVTFERARVLSHRLVSLPEGTSPLDFQVAPEFAPGVRVAVARLDRGQLHSADLAFQVDRGLTVTLVPSSSTLDPGQDGSLSIRVTDAAGQPTEAELSIAIVDDALLRAFPDPTPDLRALFAGGAPLPPAPRTSSSCTFAYAGVTVQVSAEVLAEATRLDAEEKWKAEREVVFEAMAEVEEQQLGVSRGMRAKKSAPAPAAPRDQPFASEDDSVFDRNELAGAVAFGRSSSLKQRQQSSEPSMEDTGDTLIWLPAVRTGPDGTATVPFQVPARSTRWRAVGRGADRGDGFGFGETSFQVAETLGLELRLPPGIVQGDEPVPGLRIVHPGGGNEAAELTWSATSPEGKQSGARRVELGASATTDLWLEPLSGFDGADPIVVRVSLKTASGAVAEASETLDVRPAGLAYADTAAGLLSGPRSVTLDLPDGRSYSERSLRVVLGAGVESALLDLALGRLPQWRHGRSAPMPQGPAAAAGQLLGLCAVLEAGQKSAGIDANSLERLRSRGQGLVTDLVVGRSSDGGWAANFAQPNRTTPEDTARVAWALARAQEVGLLLPAGLKDELIGSLREFARSVDRDGHDLRAALHHALATLGAADFAALNRLHRSRQSLSPAALAYTTLALLRREAGPMAAEVAQLLESASKPLTADPEGRPRCVWPVTENAGWYRSDVEQLGLSVLALRRALPSSKIAVAGATELWSRAPWLGTRGRGIALAAVAEVRTAEASGLRRVRLTIGQGTEQVIELEPGEPSFVLEQGLDAPGPLRIALSPEGGEVPYQLLLSGFSKELPKDARQVDGLRGYDPKLEPAAPRYQGSAISVGWNTVSGVDKSWTHAVSQLEFGAVTKVTVSFGAYSNSQRQANSEPLALEVPLPAGMSLLEGSFQGGLGLFEASPAGLLVPLGAWSGGGSVQFTLLGAVPGTYVMPPPVLRSLVDPARMVLGDPTPLSVLRPGERTSDEYRPTPDERFGLGVAQADAGDGQAAWDNLTVLYDTWGDDLRDDPLRETARRLLSLALVRDDSSRVVEMFEVLKEKDETYFVPFDEVLAIGAAYRTLGEYERALLIFRATIEETFGADLKITGTLANLGQTARSLVVLERLWRSFPDTPQVIDAYLALSDRLLAAAPAASGDASLKDAGWSRGDMVQAGLTHQRRFLAFYPGDPRAAEAGLALVSAVLELEDFERTARLAGEFAAAFETPRYADAFAYTQAVARWYLGEDDAALAQLKRIAAAEYASDGGGVQPSENRDLALYILGQIHHARRETDRAEDYYERVDEIFADAREALASLRERRLALAELTSVSPGQAAELEITWRNVEEASLLVYRVDLMTLYLREKDLSRVDSVNLAGIAPTLETKVALGGGRDLRERTRLTPLDLPGAGAYLVLARAGETFASGLVLVSEMELDVVEDPVQGRVRVEAQSRDEGRFLRGVDVRVVGSGNGQVTLGTTDPRGLYVADGVVGRATVIARLGDDQYAFHRGELALAQEPQQQAQGMDSNMLQNKEGYLLNVLGSNSIQIQQRALNFQNELEQDRRGVQVQQVK